MGPTPGRKLSSSVALMAAVFLLVLILDMVDGFGKGLLELALCGLILVAGLAWVWRPRRARAGEQTG
jgi:hypothetical protein